MEKIRKKVEKSLKNKGNGKDLKISIVDGPVGILTYNLYDPDQKNDFINATNATSLKGKVDSLYSEVFRPHLKYGSPILKENNEISDLEEEILEKVWEKIRAHFEDE